MRYFHQGWFRQQFQQQFQFLKRQFLQDNSLPFGDVLSGSIVAKALTENAVDWIDRIYSPLMTLWAFLGQVLSQDHSCRAAVARLIAHRVSRGQPSCSAETGAYCLAGKRLPEKFFSDVALQTGRALESGVDPQWPWNGRRVYTFDGTVSNTRLARPNAIGGSSRLRASTAWNSSWVSVWHDDSCCETLRRHRAPVSMTVSFIVKSGRRSSDEFH